MFLLAIQGQRYAAKGDIIKMLENLLETDGYNRLVRMRDGWMVYNINDQYIGASIQKYGEFSYGEMELFRQLVTTGSYIVEVGANIGSHTLGLSKQVGMSGRVFAYEPQRIIFQNLCANMSINSCSNVYCFEQAVSDEKSFIVIPDIDYSQKANFGGISIDEFTSGRPVSIAVLDEELEDAPRIDLIKVDAEGMEFKVLSGAKNVISRHKPFLYVENDRPERSQALIELIKSMEYSLYWHAPKMYNPSNYAGDKENIFGDICSLNMFCFHKSVSINCDGLTEIIDTCWHPLIER